MTDEKKPHFGQSFRIGAAPVGQASVKFNMGYRMPAAPAAFAPTGGTPRAVVEPLPDDAVACNAKGNERLLGNRPAEAIEAYDRAIALQPDYVDPHFNRGNALLRLGRNEEALASFDQAVALAPQLVLALYNRGTVLQELNRLPEAEASYLRVLELEPQNMRARFNLGCIYLHAKRFEEALACMDEVIAHAPEIAEVHNNRGTALLRLGQFPQAVASFTKALELKPEFAEASNNRGEAYLQLRNYDSAMNDLRQAIKLQPRRGESRFLLGKILREMKRYDDALAQMEIARQLSPEEESLPGEIILLKVQGCYWQNIEQEIGELQERLRAQKPALAPFSELALCDEPELHKEAARLFVTNHLPVLRELGPIPPRLRRGKIRVGYYSADFHNHATAHLMAELFETHDRERFEWFAFSFGADAKDSWRERLVGAFDHFIDVRERTDVEIAQLSREKGIDIAVDLKGYTQDARPGVFAHRAAPVQVSYLGYPGTLGADFMDYVIADKIVIPQDAQAHFSEKVVYLPHSYQVNDSKRVISDRVFTREEVGLPAEGFVFCCFNNNYKILPPTFDGWMRILQAVEGSVLWLFEDSETAARNLRQEAQARGVAPDRLVFAKRLPLAEHLARHRLADLFLDTLPYNAHTTASDALWAGLPLLTRAGRSFASRVAASLLSAVGLPELITHDQATFEARAIELARDPVQLAGIRDKLRSQGPVSPLFDARLFARHIESAYVTMHDRLCDGLPPDVIEV